MVKWYGHLHGPHRHYSMSLFKTLKAVFPHVRVFADRANSWATQRPFAHLVFFASKKPIEFKLPEKVLKAEDAPKGKKLFTWKNFQDWEQKFTESELSSVPLITDKENVLFKWYKKIARDWKAGTLVVSVFFFLLVLFVCLFEIHCACDKIFQFPFR